MTFLALTHSVALPTILALLLLGCDLALPRQAVALFVVLLLLRELREGVRLSDDLRGRGELLLREEAEGGG